ALAKEPIADEAIKHFPCLSLSQVQIVVEQLLTVTGNIGCIDHMSKEIPCLVRSSRGSKQHCPYGGGCDRQPFRRPSFIEFLSADRWHPITEKDAAHDTRRQNLGGD